MIQKNVKKIITFILIVTVLFINNNTAFAYDFWSINKDNSNVKSNKEIESEVKKRIEQAEKYKEEQEKKLEERIKSFEKDILNDKKMEEEQKKLEAKKNTLDKKKNNNKIIINNQEKETEIDKSTPAYKNLDLINNINKGKDNDIFTINISDYPLIYSEVFKALKDTNKELIIFNNNNQIVYNGKSITSPKSIDSKYEVNNNIDVIKDQYIKSGITISFASNGNLPGTAIIKIKSNDSIKNILGSENIYLYQYDNIYNKLKLKQDNISLKDGYYEFEISNSQTYILTKEKNVAPKNDDIKIDNTEETKESELSEKQKEMLIVLGSPILLIILSLIILFIVKKDNAKNKYDK